MGCRGNLCRFRRASEAAYSTTAEDRVEDSLAPHYGGYPEPYFSEDISALRSSAALMQQAVPLMNRFGGILPL